MDGQQRISVYVCVERKLNEQHLWRFHRPSSERKRREKNPPCCAVLCSASSPAFRLLLPLLQTLRSVNRCQTETDSVWPFFFDYFEFLRYHSLWPLPLFLSLSLSLSKKKRKSKIFESAKQHLSKNDTISHVSRPLGQSCFLQTSITIHTHTIISCQFIYLRCV